MIGILMHGLAAVFVIGFVAWLATAIMPIIGGVA